MTFEPEQPGQPKQELAALLKELRKRAGLSGDRLALRCNMSQSKISRIENGKVQPSLLDVNRILRAVDASAEVIAEVTALARLANTVDDYGSSLDSGIHPGQPRSFHRGHA
ncbi:helix-turn-helix transcriptional regulator [Streptomyces sparsogenes]|uniref:helix-turn-helix domain-containing protein n=1 Tax=Streptomyces sparsogenes TaxID=67365 RepID=UPI00316AD9C8